MLLDCQKYQVNALKFNIFGNAFVNSVSVISIVSIISTIYIFVLFASTILACTYVL